MKLFAVIYSLGGFAREDQPTSSIAGVYSNEVIAQAVCKAAGPTAKIVPITLDQVLPGYLDFAKTMLNMDLAKTMKDTQNGLKAMSALDIECRMPAKEFMEDADNGFLTSDDGNGYWATETMRSDVSCWHEQPDWATHVCWYNR